MLKKIIESIDNQKISIGEWIIAFVGIIFIRFILENFSSPSVLGFLVSDVGTLVHYGLFFLSTILGFSLILYFFDNKNKNTFKYFLYGLPIIWLPPIIDIIFSKGSGFSMVYISDSHFKLFMDFLTFFGPENATMGIKIEIFIALFFIGLYIWKKSKNLLKTFLTIFLSYLFVFSLGSIPGIIFTLIPNTGEFLKTSIYLEHILNNSNFVHNTFHPTFNGTYYRFLELAFNKLLSQIIFIIIFITLFVWFWQTNNHKTKVILKNSRPERTGFYFSLILIGLFYAILKVSILPFSWLDVLSLFTIFISLYGAIMFSVHINDIEDEKIDDISNNQRPISKKELTKKEMLEISYVWISISIVGSLIVSPYVLFFNLVFISAYYIYSAKPLRLKRVPILSSFLISVACLSSFLTGYFFISPNKEMSNLSPIKILGVLTIFTLAVNIRDIKDIEGDKANDIKTLPTIFKNGKKITGILFATSFLLVPIILNFYTLYILAIPAGILGYKIIMRKKYEEKYIFVLYFSFVILTTILIVGLKIFSKTIS